MRWFMYKLGTQKCAESLHLHELRRLCLFPTSPLLHVLPQDGWTGVFWAAEKGDVAVFRVLMAAGADLAKPDVVI